MIDLENKLNKFEGISLSELDEVNLSDRQDTKSLFPDMLLPEFLELLLPYYRILDMNDRRIFQYESVYYDTPELRAFRDHQRGKARRYKFRFRRYIDCGDLFFEIKSRNGKGRNLKERLPAANNHFNITYNIGEKIKARTGMEPSSLVPSLKVTVSRITLLHKDHSEKVTFDHNIQFHLGNRTKHLDNLVIAEVKQMRINPESDFFRVQRKLGVYPVSFSKYCIGIATLNEKIKANNFKQSLLRIRKITTD